MDWDKILSAAMALLFGFIGGIGAFFTMRAEIKELKADMQEGRGDRDDLRRLLQDEIRELRQTQERHYMNLVAMLQDRRN